MIICEEARVPGISKLPVELFIEGILPYLSARDIVHIGSTNKFFSSIYQDDALWRLKIQEDFNFPMSDTARKTGWWFLYKQLNGSKLYVWGYAHI